MGPRHQTYQSSLSENEGFQAFTWWLLGIGALTFALLMSARMGIFQETLYKQFGKHSKEALFYNNYIKFRLLVWQCPSCGSTSSRMSSLKPFHCVPLAGHLVCLHWDPHVQRGMEQPGDHKKPASERGQEELRPAWETRVWLRSGCHFSFVNENYPQH
ncbi:uncharacterized protein LOC118666387 isoform X4 [Myotis myotis]|uniref:uncharacterized protein LOC118666387 isoform X4 n=1 Tax=Myotis myotis TaxID=51298 RepID=UPI00174B1E78|nr:uncharacterized protein LOC118666387 isoform X4 [Myotis myotis]